VEFFFEMGMGSEAVCEIGNKKGKSEREIDVGNEREVRTSVGRKVGTVSDYVKSIL
jgi:hypothetical protein